ncbi:branched-chain amino acid transporter permease [Alkalibaculum bacchi]|uniref:branched-chain amino acid transporter permease n=1 Tax=Alkalibaculum bacchi TaxID=645887 RepID=UPI0026F1DE14|nr:branched-chain amino acid transporter permease [Alkalibaculum bacchi]
MLTIRQLIITIALITLVTYLTRAIPFFLFPENKETPKYIDYLGQVLPYAIMGMLIIYCLKGVSVTTSPHGIPELISIAFITLLHLWKNNTLISIGGSTVLYMFLVQTVF